MIDGVYVVGIAGKARAGKDTFANFMSDAIRTDVLEFACIRSMASPIKAMAASFLGCFVPFKDLNEYMYGDKKETEIEGLDVSPRVILQTLGTDWGRSCIDPEVWIKVMRSTIKKCGAYAASELMPGVPIGANMTVIIPDIRFDNEAALCDSLYLIDRPDLQEVAEHVSERGLKADLIDKYVINSGTLDGLRTSAVALAAHIKEERDNVLQRTGS